MKIEEKTSYKYRSFNGNNIKSLEDDYIWASKVEELNDPFEGLIDTSSLDYFLSLLDNITDVNPVKNILVEIWKKRLSHGIFSLSKTWKSELMWAHYADSHKGFCIEYDIPKLITYYQHPFSSVIEVKYSNNVPKIKPSLLSKKDILNVLQNINGRKSKAWEYEQEVRVIYDSAERIEIPSSAIKSIILGKKSTKENQERILKIAQIKGFSVFKSELVNKSYLIDKVPLYLTDGIRKRNNKIIPSNISYFNWSKFDKKEVSKLLWAATEKVAREDWVKSVDTVFYKRTDDDRDLVWINATPKKGITPVKQISYNRIELNQWVEKEPPKEEIDYIQKWLDNDN